MMSNKGETEKKKKIGAESGKSMNEIEVISKAFSDSNSRCKPVSKAHPVELRRLLKSKYEAPSPSRVKKSIWSWKALKAFSSDKSRKFTCCFSLQVHSIENLSIGFKELSLCVHWKRRDGDLVTRPVKVFDGIAEFEEKLTVTCSVYGTKGGPQNSVKYEVKHCLVCASVFGAPDIDLGKHQVDLARFLPLTWEELEEEKSSGKWTTSFKLSGKARGAVMNVTFGYTVLSDMKKNRKGGINFRNNVPKPTMRAVESLPCLPKTTSLSRLMEEMKEHRDILSASKSDTDDANVLDQKLDEFKPDDASVASKPETDVLIEHFVPTLAPSPVASEPNECIEKETEEGGFSVVEEGKELSSEEQVRSEEGSMVADVHEVESNQVFEINPDSGANSEESYDLSPLNEVCYVNQEDDDQCSKESLMRELELALDGITNLEAALDSPDSEDLEDDMEHNTNYETNRKSSVSLDEVAESVASDFLSMLEIDCSPISSSSESEHESPRERLLRKFEEETLASGCSLFDFGMPDREEMECGSDISSSSNLSGVLDMPTVVQDVVQEEHQMETNGGTKVRAKVLEDLETEALMHEWGLNEKAFQHSPPGSSVRLGSQFKLPPGEQLDLPPLGVGLGPLLQIKNGGFLRSMNPSLFRNSDIDGSLIMQVSSPVVVPAEMGPCVMDILQRLASVGIEKLSRQANKLMPLEDITCKTMQQVACEASPTLEGSESQYLLQHDSEVGQKKFKTSPVPSSNMLSSPSVNAMGLDHVSLEDLAPLAMDKIEALSLEGLRIQSGMSDEDAPSSISPQSIGDDVDGLMSLSLTLDKWIRLDHVDFGDEDQPSERTCKILAAHHATSLHSIGRGSKEEEKRGRKCGLLGNNFTVSLMVQLHNPIRNHEPVGAPMLALIQVERVFVPAKPTYPTQSATSNKNNQEDDSQEEEPQYRIIEVHVAGLKTEPGKTRFWGTTTQHQSGSRWLLANEMGNSNKSPTPSTTKVQPGDTLWSISSHIHDTGAKRKESAAPNPHIRNPNIIFPNETIRLQ